MRARAHRVLLMLLLACASTTQALANVRASLDTSQIAAGDTVQLTLEHEGRTSGQPDLSPLRKNFDILGTSSSTTVEILNFHASEKTELVLTLAPKTTGHLTIPALSWDGEQSQPLSLTVTGPATPGQPGASGAASPAKVFIETSVSPEQPYVQAAVRVTVRLYTAETLYHADLELPESSDVVVKQIGADETGNAERNGQPYQVVTRQYLLFPLHSGQLTLQGPLLNAEVAVRQPASSYGSDPFGGFFGGLSSGGFFRTVRPVRLQGNPIALSVRPRPAAKIGSYWLPAREVTLSAAWNPVKLTAQTGDPVTLELDLHATGLTAAQLPDLSTMLSVPPGLKAYPDQPKLSDSTRDRMLVGDRAQTIALMADKPGHYVIPALTVSWWDTQANRPRITTVPARTLIIQAAPGSTAAAAPAAAKPAPAAHPASPPLASRHPSQAPTARRPAPARSPSAWEWVSIGLVALWLATLGAWLWSRPSRGPPRPVLRGNPPAPRRLPPDPGKERAAFRAACEANDPHAARTHLLAWAAALWGTPPAGINAVAARIGNAAIAELLRDLDRACYAGGEWQGDRLAAALAELPAPGGKSVRQRDSLAPLYP